MSLLTLATKTLSAIDAALEKDQGASYRGWLGKVLPHIGDAYDTKPPGPRSHLGASLMGRDCERELYYSWRWAKYPSFIGRILRLFNRGHLEEGRVIALLLMIGVQVRQQDENGKQFRISDVMGHYGGSGDGYAYGLPDCPDTWVLLEFKTHGLKSYEKVKKDGVKAAKFEHFGQMQQYMFKSGVHKALYVAVCKDNDDIHMELIDFDGRTGESLIARAKRIITGKKAPARLDKASLTWYGCKFCDFRGVCLRKEEVEKNCRTCRFSTPEDGGLWFCNKPGMPPLELSREEQLAGCGSWERFDDE